MVVKSLQFSIVAVSEDTNDTHLWAMMADKWTNELAVKICYFPRRKIEPRDEVTGVLLEEREENLIYTGMGCVDCTLD